jgi:hypothetical protein
MTKELTMTRRNLLRSLPLAGAVAALPATAFAAAPNLATVPASTPAERVAYLVSELEAAARDLWSDAKISNWFTEDGVGVLAYLPSEPVEWDGPGIYEFRLLNRSTSSGGIVRPVAYLDRAPQRDGLNGRCFYWRHYWRARQQFQGRRQYLPETAFQIVRKVEAFA